MTAARKLLLVFVACLAVSVLVYRSARMQFLRAESGWYLFMSHADPATQAAVQRNFFTTSYGGHYTPLAFTAEFYASKVAGPSRTFWKWRQLVAVAMAGTAVFFVATRAGSALGVNPRNRNAVGAAIAALSSCQPSMLEMVSWPFMVMQLVWLTAFMVSIYALGRAVMSAGKTKWAWIAAITAYGSMHVSGLGLVTVAAVGVGLAVMRFCDREKRMPVYPLATMLCAAAVHASAMLFLLPHSAGGAMHAVQHPVALAKVFLGFVLAFVNAGIRTFTGTVVSDANPLVLGYAWPLGLAFLIIIAAAAGVMISRARRRPTPQSLCEITFCFAALAGFITMLALIAVRLIAEPSVHAAATTLAFITHAPRYVVPLHALFVPVAAIVAMKLARRAPQLVSWSCVALALAAIVTQKEFRSGASPYVDPGARVAHHSTWRLIVATVRECRAAGLPVPNVPLGAVTREFADWDAQMFLPVVRRELRLGPNAQLATVPWENYLSGDRSAYAKVPSLKQLERRLGITEP